MKHCLCHRSVELPEPCMWRCHATRGTQLGACAFAGAALVTVLVYRRKRRSIAPPEPKRGNLARERVLPKDDERALVTFDLDGTLWSRADMISRSERALAEFLERSHPSAANLFRDGATWSGPAGAPEDLACLKQRVWDEHPHLVAACAFTPLRRLVIAEVFRLARARDGVAYVDAAAIDAADAAAVDTALRAYRAANAPRPFSGAAALLRRLRRRGLTLAAVSNGNGDLDKAGLGGLFDVDVRPRERGEGALRALRPKPHADLFAEALRRSGAHAARAIHVGDSPAEDLHAARALGFAGVVWANVPGKGWTETCDSEAAAGKSVPLAWHTARPDEVPEAKTLREIGDAIGAFLSELGV